MRSRENNIFGLDVFILSEQTLDLGLAARSLSPAKITIRQFVSGKYTISLLVSTIFLHSKFDPFPYCSILDKNS